ncbi:NADP-dependent oxidoreductase [Carnobacterium gallinarum]|uniref:NADP-dependent oxidoreductase n=1 Tax=Carnobacterium gallinarum TaxID=2749 RepID=UPI00054EE81B|nr:NADP-dependent oxidoreductase [Carnobacterium gallinarum]
MYAIGFNQFGGPDVFEEIQKDTPIYKKNQLLVKTMMAGVNPYDALLRSGAMKDIRPIDFPIVPGSDLLGKVVEMGSDVTDFKIGELVIATPSIGGYAEFVAVSHKLAIPKPETMSLEMAAGFSSASVTAFWAMTGFAPIQAGNTLIIQGASGAVGSIAVQIAKDYGFNVIGTGNSRNREFVLSLGADEFVAYDEENIPEYLANQGDFVFDASFGGKGAKDGLNLVKDGGYYLSLTAIPKSVPTKKVTIASLQRTKEMTTNKALNYLTDLYQRKGLIMETALVFPLTATGVAAAHQAIDTKTIAGKILLKAR